MVKEEEGPLGPWLSVVLGAPPGLLESHPCRCLVNSTADYGWACSRLLYPVGWNQLSRPSLTGD